MKRSLLVLLPIVILAGPGSARVTAAAAAGGEVDFVRDVRPLLQRHCHACHGPEKQKSDYRLDVRSVAFTGGESHAPNIVPGHSARSPLFQFLSGAHADLRMPPKETLPAEAVEIFRRWIDQGAPWPESADTARLDDKTDHWAFKPLSPPPGGWPQLRSTPGLTKPGEPATEIDAFIHARLQQTGLQPAPEADRRTLARRLYFDLTGLPPSPEEIEAFVHDPSPRAYEALVDRLLASPRYGERWARHWLDLAHYGETHGYDKDKPRETAWPYRDYVIRAFNNDKPYPRFIEEQIAGDVLYPDTVDGITALGFIAAGPWDLIGHMEVPETKTDGKIARHLDRDDMVQNTLGAFCSLTVQCAQCHNHKFDPVSQRDYYGLQAVFAALDRTQLPYYPTDALMAQARALQEEAARLKARLAALEAPWRAAAGEPLLQVERLLTTASANAARPAANTVPDFGYHSAIATRQDEPKWVQVDLGRRVEISEVTLRPCYDDFNQIGAGFGFPLRFKVEASDDPAFQKNVTLLWRRHDETFMNDFKNPGLQPFITKAGGDDATAGRYVRVTAIKLAPRKGDFIFALAELEVRDAQGRQVAQGRPVTARDSIEAPPRWRRSNLTDGLAPQAPAAEDRRRLEDQRLALITARATPQGLAERARLQGLLAQVEARQKALPAPGLVYAGGIHNGSGAFRGTGPDGGRPRPIHLLRRGDVKSPAEAVGPGALPALTAIGFPAFTCAESASEGQRRVALARWITHRENALTWRSIVNRVWMHHFGRPIVETPNDFGRMGALPTHPELLDWLALWFRDEARGSFKALHRKIVLSAAYRRASVYPDEGMPRSPSGEAGSGLTSSHAKAGLDSDNRLLARQNRRKLDAEALRDAILSVSGALDLRMGGPGFKDFVIEKPQHSPHYQYHLHDPQDPASWRRSIYRFIVRSQQQPFMTVLDCADPSMRVDKRNESLSPLQALALLNNGLVVTMAPRFARRVEHEAPGDLAAQVTRAFQLVTNRPPRPDERQDLTAYARDEGLPNLCRLLLNLNEFIFVD